MTNVLASCAAILFLMCASLHAQWVNVPPAKVPRTPDGQANLSAPAPRLPDRKPDLSGVWRPDNTYDGKPANFENMKPASMDESGIRGIASRHGYRVEKTTAALYDVRKDPGETKDVAAEHPMVVRMLELLAEQARADLGDTLTGRKGSGIRPPGRL